MAPAISSSFPLPISVAGSGRSRCCRNSPTISAPALTARVRSSSSDSSAVNSGMSGALLPTGPFEASRAACAAAVSGPLLVREDAGPRDRVRSSRPTRNARSLGGRLESTGPRTPLAGPLPAESFPEDLDFGRLNLMDSQCHWGSQLVIHLWLSLHTTQASGKIDQARCRPPVADLSCFGSSLSLSPGRTRH